MVHGSAIFTRLRKEPDVGELHYAVVFDPPAHRALDVGGVVRAAPTPDRGGQNDVGRLSLAAEVAVQSLGLAEEVHLMWRGRSQLLVGPAGPARGAICFCADDPYFRGGTACEGV